jgi:hypothetical protein
VVEPVSYNVGPTQTEAYIFTGSSLPAKLDFTCGCLFKASGLDWIRFNFDTNIFSIFTTNAGISGVYTFVLVQSYSDFPGILPYSSFKVTVLPPNIQTQTKKSAPYFKPALQTETI